METISSSLKLYSTSHPRTYHQIHHHLKPPHHHHHHPSNSNNLNNNNNNLPHKFTKPTTTSTTTPSFSHHKFTKHLHPPLPSSTTNSPAQSPIQPPNPNTLRNAASGYAAALVDAALCSNSLEEVYKDVMRLSKWLQHNDLLKDMMADPSVEEVIKGRVIEEVAVKAKFRPHLVKLINMLVAKNKSWLVAEVMKEFHRIYFKLNATLRVVG